jgi:hypothetical protein
MSPLPDPHEVMAAVIAAVRFGDATASRERPRTPQSKHGGFGAGRRETHPLYGGNTFYQ